MLAIDFGTSVVRASLVVDGEPQPLSFDGKDELPAAVFYGETDRDDSEPMVGAAAHRMSSVAPGAVATAIKRVLGQASDDPLMRSLGRRMLSKLGTTPGGDAAFEMAGALHSPIEVAGMLLRSVALQASGTRRAVLSVPSCFDCQQRRALVDAAAVAGLTVERLYTEPVAALAARLTSDGTYLVCSVGAGVTDIVVARRTVGLIEVLGASADLGWGGVDLDRAIAQEVIPPNLGGSRAQGRLREEARTLKESLSNSEEVRLYVPVLEEGSDGAAVDIDRRVSSGDLERWLEPVYRRLELPCHDALAMAGIPPAQIDRVIACGGTAQLPGVVAALRRIFDLDVEVPEGATSAVIDGLSVLARAREGGDDSVSVIERLPATLGLAEGDVFSPVIARGTPLPSRATKLIATRLDEQTQISFSLYQGESSNIGHCHLLGNYACIGLPNRPGHETIVAVTMTVDESGLLQVDAFELVSGERVEFKRISGPGLTRAEVGALSSTIASKLP